MDKEILKEIKNMNQRIDSIKTFTIANIRLLKSILLELQKITREEKK